MANEKSTHVVFDRFCFGRSAIDQCHFNACNANFNIDSFSYYYHWSVCANNKVFYGLTRRAFIFKSLKSNHRLNWRLQWKSSTGQTINIRRKMIEHNQIFCFRQQWRARENGKQCENIKLLFEDWQKPNIMRCVRYDSWSFVCFSFFFCVFVCSFHDHLAVWSQPRTKRTVVLFYFEWSNRVWAHITPIWVDGATAAHRAR